MTNDSAPGEPSTRVPREAGLNTSAVDDFKGLAEELDVPYQTLINHYLRDCALTGRRPSMQWRAPADSRS